MSKRFSKWAVAALTVLLAACQAPITETPEVNKPHQPSQPDVSSEVAQMGRLQYVRNEVVLRYQNMASLKSVVAQMDGELLDTLPQINLALVRVKGDAYKTANLYKQQRGIAYIQPNAVAIRKNPIVEDAGSVASAGVASDQVFDEHPQYALDPRHLNAKAAWDAGLTGKGVTVAIIDDPADVSHPDLKANWVGKAYESADDKVFTSAEEWVKRVSNPSNSHGTFVASSVSSPKDGKGIVGVAPESKFMPVAIFGPQGSYSDFVIAKAIIWAVDNDAQVLNNSWGGGPGFRANKDAFNYALSRDVTVVASAGNSYRDEYQFPAGLPGLIASSALNAANEKATFSTAGRHISTGAPGHSILLARPTWQEGGYRLISGTSFSGPYTAGVAALILQKCPQATPYQVRRLMETNADSSIGTNPNGFDRDTGWGRLDAGKIAQHLTDCSKLPEKGSTVAVNVQYQEGTEEGTGYMADVLLRQKGFKPGDSTDPTPWYMGKAIKNGQAVFSEIAPGEYDVYIAGTDLSITGDSPETRGTYMGTLTALSGSTRNKPNVLSVKIDTKIPNLNPTDPYEPNDVIKDAKDIKYGETTEIAYLFGKPRDADYFKFNGKKGDKIKASTLAAGQLGGQLDTYLFLKDAEGKVLVENDDRGTPRIDQDSEITYELKEDGVYYLHVSSCNISCDPKKPQDDNNPFNRYKLKLELLK